MEASETPLEQAERHAAEGAVRVEQQVELVADLVRTGNEKLLPEALRLLRNFEDHLLLAQEHVDRELAKKAEV
jgi:phosphopantetheine adenylyltransferase